jgi:hypothetical protein
MTDVDFTLDLRVAGDPVHIDLNEIQRQPSWSAALSLCANKSGLHDKIIAADVGVDNAVWSRFKTGQNAPSGEQLDKLMTRCGNEAPLFWLLLKRGYDPRSLRRIESDVERENRELKDRMSELERERQIERRTIRELMRGQVG